jgi:hypothetical protein
MRTSLKKFDRLAVVEAAGKEAAKALTMMRK